MPPHLIFVIFGTLPHYLNICDQIDKMGQISTLLYPSLCWACFWLFNVNSPVSLMVFFMTTMTPTSLPTCFCPIFGPFFAPFFLRPFSFSLSWYDNPCSPFPTNFLPFLGLLCLCFGSQPTLHRVSTHNALFLAFDRYKDHPDLLGRNRPKFCVFCKRYTDLKKVRYRR